MSGNMLIYPAEGIFCMQQVYTYIYCIRQQAYEWSIYQAASTYIRQQVHRSGSRYIDQATAKNAPGSKHICISGSRHTY
jgi:hypothetical protein